MRFHRWNVLLADELLAARSRPFAYGSHDCLQFVARCVHAMTGVNHAASFGSYDDPTALLEVHDGVSGILTMLFGEPLHPSLAQEGDIVLAVIGERESAGICTGTKFAFAAESGGLAFLPRSMLTGCWKV
jgi:hypothetical protein